MPCFNDHVLLSHLLFKTLRPLFLDYRQHPFHLPSHSNFFVPTAALSSSPVLSWLLPNPLVLLDPIYYLIPLSFFIPTAAISPCPLSSQLLPNPLVLFHPSCCLTPLPLLSQLLLWTLSSSFMPIAASHPLSSYIPTAAWYPLFSRIPIAA